MGGNWLLSVTGVLLAIGQVCERTVLWSGLSVEVAPVPRPPPIWPTMTSEVGTPLVPNERLLVRLIVRTWPVGTVMTTGDQFGAAVGFRAAQVAVEPLTAVPQR